MNPIHKLACWWKVTGKLYVLYALLIYLALSPFLKQFPIVAKYLLEEKYVLPMIAACLYLMVQIFMGVFKGEDKEVSLRKFDGTSQDFTQALAKAKQLDILCSSTETFYPFLKNCFATKKIHCRMLLRHPLNGDDKQRQRLQHYSESYMQIMGENTECHLVIKYCTNTFSRIVILDNAEVYFGFYRFDNGRLRASDIEMIHATSGSYFGNFILSIAKNRFESLWNTAEDTVAERAKLIC